MKSLRRQLTRTLLGVLAALLGTALVALYVLVWDELVDAFDATLRARALAVRSQTAGEGGSVRFEPSEELARTFGGDQPRHFFQLWREDGVVLARSRSLPRDGFSPRRGEKTNFWNLELPTGKPGRAIGFSFTPAGAAKSERVHLVVASEREELDETLGGLAVAVAGCGVVLFGAVWLAVPWVLRRGLVPLDELGRQVARKNAGSLAAPLPLANLPRELRPIGERLNELLARLAESFERERRFSADVAHELRTPLAELRSLAECALRWPDARPPDADRDVLAIAQQMEALVEKMLALARADHGQLAVAPVATEIKPLIEGLWPAFAARAESRGLRVRLAIAPGAAPADPALLRSILANLLDNAVAYAPSGTEVVVTGAPPAAGGYALRFANRAEGLAAEDAVRMFDRFWRKDRARTGGGEHLGLGLSLAHAFAAAMGWRLEASLTPAGEIVFSLAAPAVTAA